MTPIEATVRLMESLNVTGKLCELNTGQVYDLAEQLFELFNQKPKSRARANPVQENPKRPVHVDMGGDPW